MNGAVMMSCIRKWIELAPLGLVVFLIILLSGCTNGGRPPGAVSLFDGEGFEGWTCLNAESGQGNWIVADSVSLDPDDPHLFEIEAGSGIYVNGRDGKTCNLVTTREFGDCKAHIEFCVSQNSNSGVYFMGLYEVQILDSYNKPEVTFSDCGGIYARWINGQNVEGHAPRVNASKAPGEWQTFDVVFRAPRFDDAGNKTENARFVEVRHNGVLVHEDVELTGPTRSAISETKEPPTGPLMLQGDHGPVAYRNIWIKPK